MAGWQELMWQPQFFSGLPKKYRRPGRYLAYLPDKIADAPLKIPPELGKKIAKAEAAVVRLNEHEKDLSGISRFLLRSEAIASSLIEGIAPSGRQVAMAELSGVESEATASQQAKLVANNMTILERARTTIIDAESVSVEHLVEMQKALLSDELPKQDIRTVQNWIGGNSYSPLDAEFVPPQPERVEEYLEDLVAYMNTATHSALVQAAIVHAQFETIHPFIDGNGRVGRALIYVVLARRGLVRSAILPVSMVLATFSQRYVQGLSAYRYDGQVGSSAFHSARSYWIEVFAEAILASCTQASELAADISAARASWVERVSQYRESKGMARQPRANSAVAVILDGLPATPVLSALTAQRIYKISHVAAGKALDELTEAGILSTNKSKRRTYYRADEILDILNIAERALASTRFDTRVSSPTRSVPSRRG
uniref:Fic family protein n=1 Tax=Vaginimicrobium propionicum TaxID=1871034 RepID=UPI000970AD80|nr:Fic family protein [Vaginimicrobium propionicum]